MGTELQVIREEGARLKGLVRSKESELESGLTGTGLSRAQFVAGLYQAVRNNPRLLSVGADELLNAAGRAAALGLDMSGLTGEAWPVGPVRRKGKQTVEIWLGIKGAIKLAYRSGLVKLIRVVSVYERDEFTIDPLSPDAPIHHVPKSSAGAPIARYALVFLATGGVEFGVVWSDEIPELQDKARQRLGDGYGRSPWASHPHEMADVQALRRALKWAPRSVTNLAGMASESPAAIEAPLSPAAMEADLDVTTLALEVEPETDITTAADGAFPPPKADAA